MTSLKNRLQLGLATSLVLLISLIWWFSYASISHITRQMMVTRLEHDSQALLSSLQQSMDGTLSLKKLQVGHIYQRVYSGHYYLIKSDKQQIRSHSLWDQTLTQDPLKTGQQLIETTDGPDGQHLLQSTSQYQRFQKVITITVAEDTNALLVELRQFNLYFALSTMALLSALLFIQGFIVRRSLQPLTTIKQQLQDLSEGKIKTLSKHAPSEIHPLINEVNRLLKQSGQQLKRSRNSSGNLAHRLKQPLSLLMQLAESDDLKLQHTVRNELRSNTQKILQLIEGELKRARIAGSGIPGALFYADTELPGLIDVLKRLYQDKSPTIECDVMPGLKYPADRNDMMELLGNLLDNACKWSKQRVRCKLSTVTSDSGLCIKIDDDGPGCPPQQLSSLTQRGVRVDESTPGTGLGLAIVKDIVELYSGEMMFSQSDLGGLCIVVNLP